VRLLHGLARTHASFDDPDLVSRAGLVPVMALAQRAGLAGLVCFPKRQRGVGSGQPPADDKVDRLEALKRLPREGESTRATIDVWVITPDS